MDGSGNFLLVAPQRRGEQRSMCETALQQGTSHGQVTLSSCGNRQWTLREGITQVPSVDRWASMWPGFLGLWKLSAKQELLFFFYFFTSPESKSLHFPCLSFEEGGFALWLRGPRRVAMVGKDIKTLGRLNSTSVFSEPRPWEGKS